MTRGYESGDRRVEDLSPPPKGPGVGSSPGSGDATQETPEQKAIDAAWDALWSIGQEASLRAGYVNPRYDMTYDHIYETAWGAMEEMNRLVGTVPLPRHGWDTKVCSICGGVKAVHGDETKHPFTWATVGPRDALDALSEKSETGGKG